MQPPPTRAQDADGRGSFPSLWIALGVALLAGGLTFWRTHTHGLLGFDTYPIIISARIESWRDLLGTFSERLMDGRYPAVFYRPVLNLSIALDYAAWGLRPAGYQLSSALAFGGCAWAVFLLTQRLARPGGRLAPWATMAVFLVHPSSIEVVSVPARRSESLCCMFLALALASQLAARDRPDWRRTVFTGLLTLAAIGSKEAAFLAPVLGFVAGWLSVPAGPVFRTAVRAARAALPHALAAFAALAVRLLVLGGLGGHEVSAPLAVVSRFPRALLRVGSSLLAPQPLMRGLALPIGAVLVVLLVATQVAARRSPPREPTHVGALALFALAWLLLVCASYAAAGMIQPWYLMLPAAGFSMLLGATSEEIRRALRGARRWRLVFAASSGLALLALFGLQVRYSPWVQSYPQWRQATAAGDEFLAELAGLIARTPDGATIVAPDLPRWMQVDPDRPAVFGAAILWDYSVQAWADLMFPGRRIRVQLGAPSAPEPGEVVVALNRLREGFVRPGAGGDLPPAWQFGP